MGPSQQSIMRSLQVVSSISHLMITDESERRDNCLLISVVLNQRRQTRSALSRLYNSQARYNHKDISAIAIRHARNYQLFLSHSAVLERDMSVCPSVRHMVVLTQNWYNHVLFTTR